MSTAFLVECHCVVVFTVKYSQSVNGGMSQSVNGSTQNISQGQIGI